MPTLTMDENERGPCGVVSAIVTRNDDPEGLARVMIRLPFQWEGTEADQWVRVAFPFGSPPVVPEIGAEVLVAFDNGAPFVLGRLFSRADRPR